MRIAKYLVSLTFQSTLNPRLILLSFAFCLLPFALNVTAHEPITTKVRFNKEVIRIFERSCLSCHRPNGIAPMSLATYEEARPWAKAIKEEMLEKRMPVWHAVKGFGEFRNAPNLTQREMDLIINWVEGGAPKGDDKDYPKRDVYSDNWQLGKPDLILKLSKEQKIASDADIVQTFILPTNLKTDRWVRAIDLRPDNGAVVLSAAIYLEGSQESGVRSQESGSGKRSNQNSSLIAHRSSPDSDAGHRTRDARPALATWMPGQKIIALPEDMARLIPANAKLILKIRYRGNGEDAKDKSQVGMYFAKTPPRKQLRDIAITNADALIPANAEAHQVKISLALEEAVEALALRPFDNPFMISFQASAFRPDGTEQILIWSRGHKYDWQQTYYFKEPLLFPKGTRIEVTAYFDNSENNPANPNDPPKTLRWSEISGEPLCVLSVASNRNANE
ncbi:MAG: hypothetical protein AB1757_08015 [Acidobacteriota bacterium]